MKRFEDYQELLNYIGVDFPSHVVYANAELTDFLGCEGSEIVEFKDIEPRCFFGLEIDNTFYSVGVTSVKEEGEEQYKEYYWIDN